jgi:hypothetical protein
MFGVVKQFCIGSESGQKQSVKLHNMVYSTFQHPTPPHSHSVCTCIHTLYIKKGGRGEEVREKVQKRGNNMVPSSMGATAQFTSWVKNTNHE